MDVLLLVCDICHLEVKLFLSALIQAVLDDRGSDVANPSTSFSLSKFLVDILLDAPYSAFLLLKSRNDSLNCKVCESNREISVMGCLEVFDV